MKFSFSTSLGIFLISLTLFATYACDSDPVVPQDEIQHKHHEEPVKAVVTLTKGRFLETSPQNLFYQSPRLAQFRATEEGQAITWTLSPDHGWEIVAAGAKSWDVQNYEEHPEVVYHLSIQYYDDHGHLMNHDFMEEGQDKIHQHFFSYFEDKIRVREAARLPYEYAYADEDEHGVYLAQTSPLGLDGFIRFRNTQATFDLMIDLMHAPQSKFDEQGKTSPFYAPSTSQLSKALWDISLKVPVRVQR